MHIYLTCFDSFYFRHAKYKPQMLDVLFSEICHFEVGQYALEKIDLLLCLGNECLPIQKSWKNAGRHAELFFDFAFLLDTK